MDVEVPESLNDEAAFWEGLDKIVLSPSETHEHIDDALRSFLEFTTRYKQEYLQSEYDVARCCYKLIHSHLFQTNQEYVRRQMLYCLLQEDDVEVLHVVSAFLLFDGRTNEAAFEMLKAEGVFPRLVELIRDKRDEDTGLHRLLLELLFEMSRMQRLNKGDMLTIDDAFVLALLQLIEQLSDDADDPYHYPIIRVLLVLNEQYMVFANATDSPDSDAALTNRILKLLSAHGPSYRTFGENLILLLNRESTLSAQLLILKLLYLLFTTPSTYEYFYTNDLHVLVDVIIRNLLDLDPGQNGSGLPYDDSMLDGQRMLRHTYLRVLCPLLKNTQLAREGNNYKREELRKVLFLLVNRSSAHFAPVDETVIRLVLRCKQVDWLRSEDDEDVEQDQEIERKLAEVTPRAISSEQNSSNKMLGMSLDEGAVSSLSVVDVSAKVTKEKPAVPAPRRNRRKKLGSVSGATQQTNGDGKHTNGTAQMLHVPPGDGLREVPDRDGGRSPFSDENLEV